MISVEGTEGWNPEKPLTAGKILQNRFGWNLNMVAMLHQERIGLLRKLAMVEGNIETIMDDTLKLATSPQVMNFRGTNRECRFWEGKRPW